LLNSPPTYASIFTCSLSCNLECRVGIGEKLLEIGLEPCACFWGRFESIRKTAMRIVSGSSGVGSSITFASRLDPNVCVQQWVVGDRAGSSTEASTDDVAPVAPRNLLRGLNAAAACGIIVSTSYPTADRKSFGDVLVSVRKWAGKPALTRRGASALTYLFSSQLALLSA
jgi:hypothetical protein